MFLPSAYNPRPTTHIQPTTYNSNTTYNSKTQNNLQLISSFIPNSSFNSTSWLRCLALLNLEGGVEELEKTVDLVTLNSVPVAHLQLGLRLGLLQSVVPMIIKGPHLHFMMGGFIQTSICSTIFSLVLVSQAPIIQ